MHSALHKIRYIILFSLSVGITAASGQGNIWSASKEKTTKAKQRVSQSKNTLKKWKDHISNWGLDDSYNHQFALGGKLNSNGWSGCAYYYKRIDKTQLSVWQLSFSEIKHEKQVKQKRSNNAYPQLGESTPFVYGKVNNLYTLQLGYGRQQLLLPCVVDGNLSVGFRYGGGFSLALLKPYYLRLVYNTTSDPSSAYVKEESMTNENTEKFLTSNQNIGASKWNKGLDETKPIPGAFLEAAVVIEPANSKLLVQTITLGLNAGFYSKSLPIMAEVKSYPWQASLFAGIALGKRW